MIDLFDDTGDLLGDVADPGNVADLGDVADVGNVPDHADMADCADVANQGEIADNGTVLQQDGVQHAHVETIFRRILRLFRSATQDLDDLEPEEPGRDVPGQGTDPEERGSKPPPAQNLDDTQNPDGA